MQEGLDVSRTPRIRGKNSITSEDGNKKEFFACCTDILSILSQTEVAIVWSASTELDPRYSVCFG